MKRTLTPQPSRRTFLRTTSLGTLSATVAGAWVVNLRPSAADETVGIASADAQTGWLRKTLKIGMIGAPGSLEEKFQAALDAGFEGVEPNTSPGLNVTQIKAAAEKTGLIVDGTVGGYHWGTTHTNPDPKVHEKAQSLLEQSLEQTAALGANTFLIVPGHGKDGTPEEVRSRAFDALSRAIPLADKLGVHILIENVWNHFLYDHGGDEKQSAQPLADFVDSFGTDTIGVQFDLGNHWKYGDVAEWVTTLGKRIQKLDIKGFSRATGGFTAITEGDIDWESVRHALARIEFQGWLAAEVGGGDQAKLTKIATQMETALHCDRSFAEVASGAKQAS